MRDPLGCSVEGGAISPSEKRAAEKRVKVDSGMQAPSSENKPLVRACLTLLSRVREAGTATAAASKGF